MSWTLGAREFTCEGAIMKFLGKIDISKRKEESTHICNKT